MNLHAWQDWLKLASLAQEKICLAFGSSVLTIVYAIIINLRRHPGAYIIGHVRRK